jgi:hypothetical protein
MQLSNSPGKLVLPFANSGNKNSIPVDSQIGITPGAASLADGIPAVDYDAGRGRWCAAFRPRHEWHFV